MATKPRTGAPGPFQVDQLRDGDRYDRDAGHRVVLRNLLQRQGYEDLDAVRNEGIEQSIAESVLALLEDRGLGPSEGVRERILGCRDRAQLQRWLLAAARVDAAGDLFA